MVSNKRRRTLLWVWISLAIVTVVAILQNPSNERPCWYDCPNGYFCVSQGCDGGIPALMRWMFSLWEWIWSLL